MRRQVEKLVANQALGAVKEVLGHLQRWSMGLEMQGVDRPVFLTNDYRRARRLRDKLSQQLRARPQDPELELDTPESDLLVACCLFAAQTIEEAVQRGDPHDVNWARHNMRNLLVLAFQFAQSPVELIEGPGRDGAPSPEVQRMVMAIEAKVQSPFAGPSAAGSNPAVQAPYYGAIQSSEQVEDSPAVRKGESQMGDWMTDWSPGQRNPLPHSSAVHAGEVEPVGRKEEFGVPPREHYAPGPAAGHDAAASPIASAAPEDLSFFGRRGPPSGRKDATVDPVGIEVRAMRDPRLRSGLMLDLKALRRAMQVEDHRMTAVHLGSVFEAVAIDVALQRRAELGLRGTPETWNLQRVVPAILGDKDSAADRNTIYHLVACRNLVRPAAQLVNPIVVTRQTVTKMLDFLHRFLDLTGLAARK